MNKLLDEETYRTVLDATPLVSIDLIIRRNDGRLLLGLRTNRPAQGFWFVPGGRIRKGENLDAAFQRLTFAEIGTELVRKECSLFGVYEHFYEDSVFGGGPEAPSTHYVVIAYVVPYDTEVESTLPFDQHSEFRWALPAELLAADVHPNTQAYAIDLLKGLA